mgnify:CR=1 FL=1
MEPLRRRRLDRYRRPTRPAALHLVSLMDIFTILVFFMLVHATDFQDVATSRDVALPESLAEQRQRETLTIVVTAADIRLQGEPVGSVSAALDEQAEVFTPLREALLRHTSAGADQDKGEVTIMGDKTIPFRLLKKVIATTAEAGYSRVSLAVLQKAGQGG